MIPEPTIREYADNDHQGLMSFLERVLGEMGYEFFPNGKDSDIRDIGQAYMKDGGSFHVVEANEKIQGSVGVKRFAERIAELKRLYVAADYRRRGLGYRLCLAAIEDARSLGYVYLRLDTTPRSAAAMELFRKLGFREIPRYNTDPFAEIFMQKEL